MQTLLSPAATSGTVTAASGSFHPSKLRHLLSRPLSPTPTSSISLSPLNSDLTPKTHRPNLTPFHFSSLGNLVGSKRSKLFVTKASSSSPPVSSPPFSSSPSDDVDKAKLAQVAKRLENTSRYFRRLGNLGFWGQLVCTVVAAVILSFSVVITGKITSPASFYATAGGIAAAFISVFWSFGYIRLSERLRRTANEPSKAPPRADVVKSLKNGIILNILGMGAAILGMQATVGLLVAKALTSSANPYFQGVPPGYNPVLALDVFLVQASANTILSHFLGLIFSLELLRSVTLPPTENAPVPRLA